jgi:hypothetical protein
MMVDRGVAQRFIAASQDIAEERPDSVLEFVLLPTTSGWTHSPLDDAIEKALLKKFAALEHKVFAGACDERNGVCTENEQIWRTFTKLPRFAVQFILQVC